MSLRGLRYKESTYKLKKNNMAVPKQKLKINRLPEYRSISAGYSWDNGTVAFGKCYDHKLHLKQKYQERKVAKSWATSGKRKT